MNLASFFAGLCCCLLPVVAADVRVLNNLVSEFDLPPPAALHQGKAAVFQLERDRWVWISAGGSFAGGDYFAVRLGDSAGGGRGFSLSASSPSREAMWYLPAGVHELILDFAGNPKISVLTLRKVPELVYHKFQGATSVSGFGPYDWSFLVRHLFSNVNTIVGQDNPLNQLQLEDWTRHGGRWFAEVPLPAPRPSISEVIRKWSQSTGMSHPQADGIFVDEFTDSTPDLPAWSEAVTGLMSLSRHSGKEVRPYLGGRCTNAELKGVVQAAIKTGGKAVLECYLGEPGDAVEPGSLIEAELSSTFRSLSQADPSFAANTLVALGYFSAPPESLDRNPALDFKVWMDLQMHALATGPDFKNLAGCLFYTAKYADEEYVRWGGELFRHYGIQGRTNLLSASLGLALRPGHLRNPDFESGAEGWQFQAAQPGGINIRFDPDMADLTARYPRGQIGRKFAWIKQDSVGTNRLSQVIRHLVPGETYSLKFMSADYSDWRAGRSAPGRTPVTASLTTAELLSGLCFQEPLATSVGPESTGRRFNRGNPAWVEYHRVVFRANSPSVTLTFQDAPSEHPVEWLLSFVQVQRYLLP